MLAGYAEHAPLMGQACHLAVFFDIVLIAAAAQQKSQLSRYKCDLFLFMLNSVHPSLPHFKQGAYRGRGGRLQDKPSRVGMETDPGSRTSSSEIKGNPT